MRMFVNPSSVVALLDAVLFPVRLPQAANCGRKGHAGVGKFFPCFHLAVPFYFLDNEVWNTIVKIE